MIRESTKSALAIRFSLRIAILRPDSTTSKNKGGDEEGEEGVDEVKDREVIRERVIEAKGEEGVGLVVEDVENTTGNCQIIRIVTYNLRSNIIM